MKKCSKAILILCVLSLFMCGCKNAPAEEENFSNIYIDKLDNPYVNYNGGVFSNATKTYYFDCEEDGGVFEFHEGAAEKIIDSNYTHCAVATDNSIYYYNNEGLFRYSIEAAESELISDNIIVANMYTHNENVFIWTKVNDSTCLIEKEAQLLCGKDTDFGTAIEWENIVGNDVYGEYTLYYVTYSTADGDRDQLAAISSNDGWSVSFTYNGTNYLVDNNELYEIDYSHNGRLNPDTFAKQAGGKAYYIYQVDNGKAHNPVEANFDAEYLEYDELDCVDIRTNTNETIFKAEKGTRIIGFDMSCDTVYLFSNNTVKKHIISSGDEAVIIELSNADIYHFAWANGKGYAYYFAEDGAINVTSF